MRAFAVQKHLTFFYKKEWRISDINVWNFNETLTNDVVSLEQPGPECNIQFIIWSFKSVFYYLQKGQYFNEKTHCWHGHCQWHYIYAPKCYYTCGHKIFISWRWRHIIKFFNTLPSSSSSTEHIALSLINNLNLMKSYQWAKLFLPAWKLLGGICINVSASTP